MNHKKYYKKDLYNIAKQFKNQHNVKGISKLKSEQLYTLLNQHNIRLPTRVKGKQVRKPNKNQLRKDYEEFENLSIFTNPTRKQKIDFMKRMHKKYKNYHTVKNNPFPKGSEEFALLLRLSDSDMFDFSLEKDIKKAKLQRAIKKRPFLKTPKTSVRSAIQRRKYIKKKPVKKKARKRVQSHIEKPYSYTRIRKYKTNPMFDDDYTPRFKPSKQHEVEFTKKRMKLAGMDDEGFISYPYTPKKE